MKLRDYQQKAADSVLAAWKDHRSCVVVLPTGCGKTAVHELLKDSRIPDVRAKLKISRPTMRTIIKFLKVRFELSYQALRAYRAFRSTLRF